MEEQVSVRVKTCCWNSPFFWFNKHLNLWPKVCAKATGCPSRVAKDMLRSSVSSRDRLSKQLISRSYWLSADRPPSSLSIRRLYVSTMLSFFARWGLSADRRDAVAACATCYTSKFHSCSGATTCGSPRFSSRTQRDDTLLGHTEAVLSITLLLSLRSGGERSADFQWGSALCLSFVCEAVSKSTGERSFKNMLWTFSPPTNGRVKNKNVFHTGRQPRRSLWGAGWEEFKCENRGNFITGFPVWIQTSCFISIFLLCVRVSVGVL